MVLKMPQELLTAPLEITAETTCSEHSTIKPTMFCVNPVLYRKKKWLSSELSA